MTLCHRLIGGAVNLLADTGDMLASFWQTPREVEWAKAAGASGEPCEGCGHRIHDSNVCPVGECLCLGWFPDRAKIVEPKCGPNGPQCDDKWCLYCVPMVAPKTSAPTPGAVDGPAEGSPDKPSAVVDKCTCPWVDPELWTVHYGAVEPGSQREFDPSCPEHGPAFSAEVEPPASVPSAESRCVHGGDPRKCGVESPAPEFDWVTAAIPVIAGVLAEHVPSPVGVPPRTVFCGNADRVTFCAEFGDMQDWRNHVSPIIAARLQTENPRK